MLHGFGERWVDLQLRFKKRRTVIAGGAARYTLDVYPEDSQTPCLSLDLPDQDLAGGYSISSSGSVSPDGRLLIITVGRHFMGDNEHETRIHDLEAGQLLYALDADAHVTFSADDRHVHVRHQASGAMDRVDARSGDVVEHLEPGTPPPPGARAAVRVRFEED